MFKFLKDKLKSAVKKFSKDVEEEAEDVDEPIEEPEDENFEEDKAEEDKEKDKAEDVKEDKEEESDKDIEEDKEEDTEEIEDEEPEQEPEEEPEVEVPEPEKEEEPVPKPEVVEKEEPTPKPIVEDKKEEEPDISKMTVNEAATEPEEEKKEEEKEEIKDIEEIKDKKEEPQEDIEEEIPTPPAPEDKDAEEPEEDLEESEPEEDIEEPKKKKGFFSRLFKKEEKPEEDLEESEPEEKPEPEAKDVEEPKPEPFAEEDTLDEVEEKEEEKREEVEKEEMSDEDQDIADIDEEKKETQDDLQQDDKDLEEIEEEQKKGFFGKLKEKVGAKKLSESKFEDLFFDLEIALLENNCAVEVIEKIKEDLKKELVDRKLNRFDIERIIMKTLKRSLDDILTFDKVDIIRKIKDKEGPFSIVFVGINGSGKTTTIAKMAQYFLDNDLKVVLVAADTFRAAAIQQLEEHATNLKIKMIKHDYGSDPAAVAFDGQKYAESKGIDVVLIDTAGRLHSNQNLMDEMDKIIRVSKPDMKIFIGESITGNDCVEQAQKFNETVKLDGIVLSKADVDEKGGAAISVSYVTGKPILFLGTGQEYKDLEPFNKKKILANLGL